LKRIKRGLEFSDENLALGVIAEAGPGGSYMENMHTIANMRRAALYPNLAIREMREIWEEKGRPDAQACAINQAGKILGADNPAVFSAELDRKIRARFTELVAGDSGWKE
ncbi:hypothetical protein LCGC14_2235960, partial [marine sediment metagenome]